MRTWGRLARLRQGLYRLLAVSFLPPRPERWQQAVAAARYLRGGDRPARPLPFYERWRAFARALLTTERGEADAEYGRLFGPGGPVPLWESSYLPPDPLAQGEVVADVKQAYLRAGLRPSSPEGPDHLSTELEFLSFLCGQEAAAWEEGDVAAVRRSLKRQGKFLDRHLCLWLPGLVRRLEEAAASPLFLEGARAAWALACHDRDLAQLLDMELAIVGEMGA